MHICEQVVNSANYLEEKGFTQKQLSSLHHRSLDGGEESFSSLLKYFSVNKNLQKKNANLANRIIFVAEQYKLNKYSFSQLIEQALEKWPLLPKEAIKEKKATQIPSGIYVVTLNNKTPISINAQDPRYADKVYKANYKNVKVGKAKSLKSRMRNYFKTFGEENVNFLPIIITADIDKAENIIMKKLDDFRVRNPISKVKTEWLIGITRDRAIEIAVSNIYQSNITYSLADGITVEEVN